MSDDDLIYVQIQLITFVSTTKSPLNKSSKSCVRSATSFAISKISLVAKYTTTLPAKNL